MNLTADEKKLLYSLVKKQLEEVKYNEHLRHTPPNFLAGEIKYEQFLKNLLTKLK